jgi:hypothetical protein
MSPRRSSRWMKQMKRLSLVAFGISAATGMVSCRRAHATSQDCEQILNRIVQLELEERGFHDPVLVDRKQREMREMLAAELKECKGKRMKTEALACVRTAKDTEQISHVCLR